MKSLPDVVRLVLPTLESIRSGFGRKPVAELRVLQELANVAGRVGGAAAVPTVVEPRVEAPRPPVVIRPVPVDGTSPKGAAEREWTWESLREAALRCIECRHLVASRTQVVFGSGKADAELMFVGEAPGGEEDQSGEPLAGRGGELLTKIIQTMGFARDEVYIANVLKCRPDMPAGSSGNRKATKDEMAACLPWLRAEIGLVKPKVLVVLGATAAEGLLGETRLMRELRGRWLEYEGIPVMVTYHPDYLLRNQSLVEKRKVWEDMLLVLDRLGRPVTAKQQGFFLPKP